MDISVGNSLVDLSGHIALGKLIANVNFVMLLTCLATELGIGTSINPILPKVYEDGVNNTSSIPNARKSVRQFLSLQPVYASVVLAPLAVGCILISPLLFFVPFGRFVGAHLLLSGLTWFITIYYLPKK